MIAGCKKESAKKAETQQEKIEEIIPGKYLNVLKEMGMPIHAGATPPDITGIYLANPWLLQKTNIEGDFPPGYRYNDNRFGFSEQNVNDFSIQAAISGGGAATYSEKAVISGSGNNFTVYVMTTGSSSINSGVYAILYSGTLEGNAIKSLKEAFICVYNSNNASQVIKEGNARIKYDENNISERVSSLYP
ncbi:hypothetical protein GCM10027516_17240 [Niabella aquatica]